MHIELVAKKQPTERERPQEREGLPESCMKESGVGWRALSKSGFPTSKPSRGAKGTGGNWGKKIPGGLLMITSH